MEKNSTLSFFVDVFKGARDNATFVQGLSTSGFQYLFQHPVNINDVVTC